MRLFFRNPRTTDSPSAVEAAGLFHVARTRRAACALLTTLGFLTLAGCGYVSETLPPALQKPTRILDVAAVERGAKIIVQFTPPQFTTEGLPIKKAHELELRWGVCPVSPFQFEPWEKAADVKRDIPWQNGLVRVELPAEKYVGKDIVIGVKALGPAGRNIGWSNLVQLSIVTPLPVPLGVTAKDVAAGIQVEWHAAAAHFRVFRRVQGTVDWLQAGLADKASFVDTGIEYGKTYQYFVQTIEKAGEALAESELSEVVDIKPVDTFPPAVPTGLRPVPGARSIELLWDRNIEGDLAGYRIYRDGKRLGDTVVSPAYSDKAVQPGVTYKYQVSSIDRAGNESALCAAVEAVIP